MMTLLDVVIFYAITARALTHGYAVTAPTLLGIFCIVTPLKAPPIRPNFMHSTAHPARAHEASCACNQP